MNTKAQKVKIKGYGLVRDKDGRPLIDDYNKCPEELKALLTTEERERFEKCL